MALMELAVVLSAALVYLTGRWWGAPVTMRQRALAALVAFALGEGAGLAARSTAAFADLWWFAPAIALLVIVAVVDRLHQIIPNRLVALMALWALASRWHYGHWVSAAVVALGVFLFYLAVNLVTSNGLGMGDVKFAAVLALALGYPAGLVSLVFGMWAAGIYAVFLLLWRRRQKTQFMALGPFLAFGGMVGLLLMLHG